MPAILIVQRTTVNKGGQIEPMAKVERKYEVLIWRTKTKTSQIQHDTRQPQDSRKAKTKTRLDNREFKIEKVNHLI
jgi:hypothetical protein